jgi:hypothetical protein
MMDGTYTNDSVERVTPMKRTDVQTNAEILEWKAPYWRARQTHLQKNPGGQPDDEYSPWIITKQDYEINQ